MTTTAAPGWYLGSSTTAARTMARMASLCVEARGAPIVWETARDIVAGCSDRDEMGQALTLRGWVKAHVHYVNDPAGVELIADPRYLLAGIRARGFVQGDCDDAASLAAALGLAIGIPAEFVAAGPDPRGPYTHVFTVLYPRLEPGSAVRQGVEMDTTRPDSQPQLPAFGRALHYKIGG